MSLMYAKESIIMTALKDVEENQKRMQEMNLAGSNAWKAKSLLLTTQLAEHLYNNTRLTALNLRDCNINDAGIAKMTEVLAHNASLFHLDLSLNKLARPALLGLGSSLKTNTGLISLELTGLRIDGAVSACFLEAFGQNFTLCKLIWDPEISGYNLKFTEMLNRNSEIDRAVREGKPYDKLLPEGVPMPELTPRVVPDPDEDEHGLELGEDSAMVWCKINGRWELGKVEGRRGTGQRRKLVVSVEETEHEMDPKEATQFEPSHAQNLPNMVMMGNLHEAPLLYLLQRRLTDHQIYTWAGDVLISLNPYSAIPSLYQVSTFLDGGPSAAESPHVYSISKRAYLAFLATMALDDEQRAAAQADGLQVNQSVLISGESGAGKTEACKRVLEFLTAASRRRKQAKEDASTPALATMRSKASQALLRRGSFAPEAYGGGGGGGGGEDASVEMLLREASPVLEAFGNAKTIRNDNSSRFGKYVAVQYDAGGVIVGASSETYLLERSRVVEIANGERNYHIFYQLLTDQALRDAWGLLDAADMMYLSSEPPYVEVEEEERNEKGRVIGTKYVMVQEEGPRRVATIAGQSDAQELAAVRRGLAMFGLSDAEVQGVWRILASVMLLGNCVFAPKEGLDREVAVVAEERSIVAAAAALGCDVEALRFPMTRKTVTVAGESVEVEFTCKLAGQSRDALAKVVYATLFDWIVARINDASRGPDGSHVIGILDIFGFEKLKVNSFEQLCINFVNEMLQEQFNETVFAAEKRLLKAEAIEADDSSLQSSAARLGLMARLLGTLDEQCRLGERASDGEFLNLVGKTIAQHNLCKLEQAGVFSINHYAGKVFYTAEGFVMKNTDTMQADMSDLMLACDGLGLLRGALQAKADRDAGRAPASAKGATDAAAAAPNEAAAPAAAPAKMSIAERMAAMQKSAAAPEPTADRGGRGRGGKKKEPPPTLGGRLRTGIGEVKSGGGGTGLMGLLSTTTTHYIRCVKPNDDMAAFGFQQPRVLQQLQYSGVVEMVRIRRSGYPGRMPYAEFAHQFGALTFRDVAALPAAERAATEPRARCVAILEAAGLQPERHYALGTTMVFLRNAVEGALRAKTAQHTLVITWLQSKARAKVAKALVAALTRGTPPTGAAKSLVEAMSCGSRAKHMKPGGAPRAQPPPSPAAPAPPTPSPPTPPAPPAPTAASAQPAPASVAAAAATAAPVTPTPSPPGTLLRQNSALASKISTKLAGRRTTRGSSMSDDAPPPPSSAHMAVDAGTSPAAASSAPPPPAASNTPAATAPPPTPRAANTTSEVMATVTLQRSHWWRIVRNRRERLAVNGMFDAAYGDDQDAMTMAIQAFPELLTVRQDRPGQRATLAHAAAAGGAVRIAPLIMRAMHAAAVAEGRPEVGDALARALSGAGAAEEQREAARLRVAVRYCCGLRDVLGRTPLHYAARAAQAGFLQWAFQLLCTRPRVAAAELLLGMEASPADDGSNDLRRAVMGVKLPGAPPGPAKRMLVSLRLDALRIYALPAGTAPRAASAEETVAAQAASAGEPLHTIACDALLYRKGRAGPKARQAATVQIVLLGAGAAGAEKGEDVLDLVADNATEARLWMAGLAAVGRSATSHQGLAARVASGTRAATQLELSERQSLLDETDHCGEGLVHALVRGIEPGDEAGRGALLAWLLAQGCALVEQDASGHRSSALELLLTRAAASTSSAAAHADATCAAILAMMLRQASCVLPAAALETALHRARAAHATKLLEAAPATHAALHLDASARHGAASQLAPPPSPASLQPGLRMLLLSISTLDCGPLSTRSAQAAEVTHRVPPAEVRMAISLVNQPANTAAEGGGGGGGRAGDGPGVMSQEETAVVTSSLASRIAALGVGGDAAAAKGAASAAADDLGTLSFLVDERMSAPPLSTLASGLLWHTSWSALQLPGEEAAMVLLQFVHPAAIAKGGARLIGWVAIPAESCGEHHVQLRAPPLPKSAAEARSASAELLEGAWVHCQLDLAVTSAWARSAAPSASAGAATPPPAAAATAAAAAAALTRGRGRGSVGFSPNYAPSSPAYAAASSAAPPPPPPVAPAPTTPSGPSSPPLTPPAATAGGPQVDGAWDGARPSAAGGDTALPVEVRSLLAALPAPKVRGKLPPRKWGKMESREQVAAMLVAAAAAAEATEYELAMRGYLRAFEVTRSLPLMLSVINMHIKLGELDAAQSYADVVQEQAAATAGLTPEQKAVLAKKMGEITVTRQRTASEVSQRPGPTRRVSVWQQKLDQAQIELLNK